MCTLTTLVVWLSVYPSGAVILVLGKVNLGKSTFSRFVINSLLNRHKQVGFLECDVGQTEFTPPGIISVHLIKKPVTGNSKLIVNISSGIVFVNALDFGLLLQVQLLPTKGLLTCE